MQRWHGRQAGVTLVELMVALVIGLVVSLATVATLIAARAGYSSVDSSSQVRENARFAIELIQRIAVQAGYEDVAAAVGTKQSVSFAGSEPSPEPDVMGYDNAVLGTQTSFPPSVSNNGSGCSTSSSACSNNSDVLVLRYQGSSLPSDAGTADGSIINCAGVAEVATGSSSADRLYSVFHVERSSTSGEPVLMCSYRNTGGTWTKQALVQGVESFQVLYGMDYGNSAVAANVAVSAAQVQDSVPDRYLRADQIIVPGNADATRANWRRVRSLRIGLLLRSAPNTALDLTATGKTYYPLGVGQSSSYDIGTAFAVTADGRLRQELSATVYLRNRVTLD